MANPRRPTYSSYPLPISDPNPNSIPPQFQPQPPQTASTFFNSLKIFLKKPHAFPFLLSIFCLLAWVSLRLQHRHANLPFRQSPYTVSDKNGGYSTDSIGNVVKFSSVSSPAMKDKRGWLIDPISVALDSGVSGGAISCASVHVGEIKPGTLRGNHRHHTCNETFIVWGAKTVLRLENKELERGYSEVTVDSDEVAVAASSSGSAHALLNVDTRRSTFFVGCQDKVLNYTDSTTDFGVWKDL